MTDEVAKELSDRFINDTMFVRAIFCHPNVEAEIKSYVMADDIRVYISSYIEPNKYIKSTDISVEINIESGHCKGDFENNRITVIASPRFY